MVLNLEWWKQNHKGNLRSFGIICFYIRRKEASRQGKHFDTLQDNARDQRYRSPCCGIFSGLCYNFHSMSSEPKVASPEQTTYLSMKRKTPNDSGHVNAGTHILLGVVH